jgi:hypothetical protein
MFASVSTFAARSRSLLNAEEEEKRWRFRRCRREHERKRKTALQNGKEVRNDLSSGVGSGEERVARLKLTRRRRRREKKPAGSENNLINYLRLSFEACWPFFFEELELKFKSKRRAGAECESNAIKKFQLSW